MNLSTFLSSVLRVRLTRPQFVLVRVCFDGDDPEDLTGADRDIAFRLFGGVKRIPREARHVIAWLKGARMGGTWLCSLALLHAALTIPLDGMAAGEQAFGPIVAPDLRLARQALRYAIGAAESVRSIRAIIVSSSSDSMTLRRPDGRLVTLECLPASRGGSATRGRTLIGALMDEASFFYDHDMVVNDSEVYRSIAPRILPGGKLCIISTAWAESGLLYDLVHKNKHAPQSAIAAELPTLVMRPDDAQLRRVVEQERARDPENAEREFDCKLMSSGTGLYFDPASITRAIDSSLVLPAPGSGQVACAADFGFVRDSSALVAVSLDGGLFTIIDVHERRPERDEPLKPSVVVEAFADIAKRLGVGQLVADQHYQLAVKEYLTKAELKLVSIPEGQAGKVAMFTATKSALNEGRIRLPEHPRLIAQLRQVVSRPTPGGGMQISSPRRAGQGHGDLVSAMVAAVHRLADSGARRVPYTPGHHSVSERGRTYPRTGRFVLPDGRILRTERHD